MELFIVGDGRPIMLSEETMGILVEGGIRRRLRIKVKGNTEMACYEILIMKE